MYKLLIVLFLIIILYKLFNKNINEYFSQQDNTIVKFIKNKKIKNLIVWGLKNKYHTHRYIHSSIFKTFNYIKNKYKLNISVLWIEDSPTSKIINNSIIFSSPHYGTDIYLPLNENNYYILHYHDINIDTKEIITKYDNLIYNKKAVLYKELRYNKDLKIKNLVKIKPYFFYNKNKNQVIMPWATNLNPDEIMHNIKYLNINKKNKNVSFVGTIWHVNKDTIEELRKSCIKNNLIFKHYIKLSDSQNEIIIKNSYLAPAIQGDTHINSYIPCRIFKNISYGTFPVTNNYIVYDLFKKKFYMIKILIILSQNLKI